MKGKVFVIVLIFAAYGSAFAQVAFEAGILVGGGNAAVEGDDKYEPGPYGGFRSVTNIINAGRGYADIGLQFGGYILDGDLGLLLEGGVGMEFPKIELHFNGGGIVEYYFLSSETWKLGAGLGGGYGRFNEEAPYARVAMPVLLDSFKLGIHGDLYFHKEKKAFRGGIMIYLRGGDAMDFASSASSRLSQ